MRKMLYIMPILLLLMAISVLATLDVTWTCPVSGSSSSTTVKNYAEYSDSGIYKDCGKSGNNFTIEFAITGDANDWGSGNGNGGVENMTLGTTLYINYGGSNKLTLPLTTASTNTSATSTALIRWTDFGELYTSDLTGLPKWYNNLTEGSYKWYIVVTNTTDVGAGAGTGTVLTSERGMSSSYPVAFTLDLERSAGLKTLSAAQADVPGTEGIQSALGIGGKLKVFAGDVGVEGGFIAFFLIMLLYLAVRKE